MRITNYFAPTRKEAPKDAEIPSHQMMLRAGLIRQHVAGAYAMLPMGWRIIKNIMNLVREEMDAIGCHEFYLPALSPGDLWQKSGRWETFGDDMFKFKDRKGREMCLAPTHEEVFTELAANEIQSYRDLPKMWYQIQTKFRDEVRPRSGLLRVRQFFMKDAYSFDASQEGLDKSYALQREAYLRIFERSGLNVKVVRASSGAMGGGDCEEFMVLSPSGDDEIVNCSSCGYASNQEVADSKIEKVFGDATDLEKVPTPGKRTIKEVASYLKVDTSRLVKSLLYVSNKESVFVLVRGDHQVDNGKLEAALGECRPAEADEVKKVTGADIGFISPVGLKDVRVIADPSLQGCLGLVAGANENDFHFMGVDMSRDIEVESYVPLRTVDAGEECLECGEKLEVSRAIEVGHIFKLGTRYSKVLGATFLDENGDEKPVTMGSYGIGIERIMASAVETHFDGSVMSWPRELAPFMVQVMPLNVSSEPCIAAAEGLYKTLADNGVATLMDDRDDRAGVKFKDADLFGIPVVVVIGDRGLKEGVVEVRDRSTGEVEKIAIDSLAEHVIGLVTAK